MKLQLNGIEFEVPGDAQVDVSEDGKKVTIRVAEPKVVEKIRVVEVPGQETIRYIPGPETIRYIEVEKPCTKPHYYTWPYTYPYTTTTGPLTPTWGTTITVSGGALDSNGSYTIGGLPSSAQCLTEMGGGSTSNITYTTSSNNISIT